MKQFLDIYWVIYFAGYLVAVAVMLWLRWDDLLHGDGRIHLLATVYGAAAGSASAFAIIVEVGGRTMLLIPKAVRELMDKGREEGRQEERKQGHERRRQALEKFGVEVDGVRMLPDTPEVNEFLESPPASNPP